MKIGQVAPLMESVPPRLYGGTERIVSYLTEELVRMGHEVTLFASGDSITSAQLVGCVPTAIRLDANIHDSIAYYMLMLDRVRDAAEDFDILHSISTSFISLCSSRWPIGRSRRCMAGKTSRTSSHCI